MSNIAGIDRSAAVRTRGDIGFDTCSRICVLHFKSAYVRAVAACDESALIAARLQHCFDISRVCRDKHRWLRSAARAAVPALVLTVLAAFLNV